MNEYTDHAVVDLDEAGSIIANKNIKIDCLNQKLAAAEARIAELERQRDELLEQVECSNITEKNMEGRLNKLIVQNAATKDQRDELLTAAEAIEINAEECLDWDDCTAMLVPIGDYHKLMEALAAVKAWEDGK